MNTSHQNIGAKPSGVTGLLAGMGMNLIHASQYRRIIKKHAVPLLETECPGNILDIGCGGGKTVQLFSALLPGANIYGLDHSLEMVELSGRVNRRAVSEDRVKLIQGDVRHLPFPDGHFNLATAFDTVNFWTAFDTAISEILRTLKKGGVFMIVNAFPREGTRWWDFVKFKNEQEYLEALITRGFSRCEAHFEKDTIVVIAEK